MGYFYNRLCRKTTLQSEGMGMSAIAPPGQEGWLCHKENIAKQPLSAQTGWLFKLKQSN
jgi:hypothetical protein